MGECGISQIVLGELEFGIYSSSPAHHDNNREALEDFLSGVSIHPLDNAVARRYGQLRAHLRRAGTPIGPNDLWTAAHASAMQVPLVTGNIREFARVPELTISTWLAE